MINKDENDAYTLVSKAFSYTNTAKVDEGERMHAVKRISKSYDGLSNNDHSLDKCF